MNVSHRLKRLPPTLVCVLAVLGATLPGVSLVSTSFAAGAPPAPPPPPATEYPPDPNDPDPPKPKAVVAMPPPDPALVAKGSQLFKDYCQKCHGLDMVSPGPPFFDLRTFPHDEKTRFVDSVTNGKRAMPAWGAIVKPEEIQALWAYVSAYQAK